MHLQCWRYMCSWSVVKAKTKLLKWMDATFGVALCRLISRWRHWTGKPELGETPSPASVQRILVIRPGGMGDMILLIPVLREMATLWPAASIDIICEQRNRSVLALADLDIVSHAYDRNPLAVLSRLRKTRYDLAIDTEQFHHFSAIMCILSGAPVRVGYKINPMRLSLYTHLVSYDVDGYELDQFYRLLKSVGVSPQQTSLSGCLAACAQRLRGNESRPASETPDARHIALAPGSANPSKQWPVANMQALIMRWSRAGHHIVLLGAERLAPDDALQATLRECPAVSNETGTTSLEDAATQIAQADVFVGCDSGLTHLAVALSSATVSLFGPSDPRKWHNPGERHICLSLGLPCSPCSIFGYQKLCRDVPCMSALSTEAVDAAVAPFLQ